MKKRINWWIRYIWKRKIGIGYGIFCCLFGLFFWYGTKWRFPEKQDLICKSGIIKNIEYDWLDEWKIHLEDGNVCKFSFDLINEVDFFQSELDEFLKEGKKVYFLVKKNDRYPYDPYELWCNGRTIISYEDSYQLSLQYQNSLYYVWIERILFVYGIVVIWQSFNNISDEGTRSICKKRKKR